MMAVGDAHVFSDFLTPVLTQLFFPKPPTTFLACFCRSERRKYTRRNWVSNSQPPGSPLSHLDWTHAQGKLLGSRFARREVCGVNFSFKHLLLNCLADLNLGRNVPWEVLFKNCSQNLIPSEALVHGCLFPKSQHWVVYGNMLRGYQVVVEGTGKFSG